MNKLFTSIKLFFSRKHNLVVSIVVLIILGAGGYVFYYVNSPRVLPQQAITGIDDAVLPQSGDRVIVFSPHPDDETIGIGGFIAQAVKNNAVVRIVLVTDGNIYHQERIRYTEFKEATSILGVSGQNLVFLNYPDGSLHKMDPNVLKASLRAEIDKFQPTFVLYPHPRDAHPDHYTTGIVMENIFIERPVKFAYKYLVHYEIFYPQPRKLAPNLSLLPPARLIIFNANWRRIMLTKDVEDLKTQSTRAYKSQLKVPFLHDLLLSSIRRNELIEIYSSGP